MTGRTCGATGCDRIHKARGLCHRHYEHQRRYGRAEAQTVAERFWAKVNKTSDCWLWTAAVNDRGYGKFYSDRYEYAHRYAYRALVGPIPEDLTLDHLCRTPGCVNPAHLEPVTRGENRRRATRAMTHCPNGHAYTPENTATGPCQERRCRECSRLRTRRQRKEQS